MILLDIWWIVVECRNPFLALQRRRNLPVTWVAEEWQNASSKLMVCHEALSNFFSCSFLILLLTDLAY